MAESVQSQNLFARKARFDAKVDKTPSCWTWKGALQPNGYGYFAVGSGRSAYAHRVSYEMARGPIPHGLQIDHLCRNRACVNPDHLEIVTNAENRRRAAPFRDLSLCQTDRHPMTDDNLFWHKGVRRCKECTREKNRTASREYRARRRGISCEAL